MAVDASGGTPTLHISRDPEAAPVTLYESWTTPLAPGEACSFVAALHPDGTRLAVAQAESIALITLP